MKTGCKWADEKTGENSWKFSRKILTKHKEYHKITYAFDGVWRSLVARSAGGREVAGSNPVTPIYDIEKVRILRFWPFLFYRKYCVTLKHESYDSYRAKNVLLWTVTRWKKVRKTFDRKHWQKKSHLLYFLQNNDVLQGESLRKGSPVGTPFSYLY